MKKSRRLVVSVIGASEASSQIMRLAEEVGQRLAARGVDVVCGGLSGVMEAVCKGVKKEGGMTIGILPGHDPEEANRYVDIPIPTGMGYARNTIVVKTGRVVIAIGGAYGTLSEIGHALADNTPVVGLQTWDLVRSGKTDRGIIVTKTPNEAVEQALAEVSRRDGAWQPAFRSEPL